MKTLIHVSLYFTLAYLTLAANAQSNLVIKTSPEEWSNNFVDVRLEFDSDSNRRYMIERSVDLADWEPHYLSPFEYTEEGYWVRQLDLSNPYTPSVEFYKVDRLPWTFQTLDNSGDWIGDMHLTSNGSVAFLVYQNRDSNTLFLSQSDQGGYFQDPEVIASTGAVDEGSYWDNSGFSDITIAHYGPVLYLVCTDDISRKVILLRKNDDSSDWICHEISEVIDEYFWAFPKFSISSAGVLGVACRNNEGTTFSYANHSTPEHWQSVVVTTDKPSSSRYIKTTFSTPINAHVYVKYAGSFKISTADGSVTSESYPSDSPSDLTTEETGSIESIYRYEGLSNHVRLPDGRIVVGLSDARRVIMAVEEQ